MKTFERKPFEASGQQPVEKQPSAKKPVAKKPFVKKSFDKKPFAKKPAGEAQTSSEKKPFGKKPFERKPFDRKPAGKKTFDRKPAGKFPRRENKPEAPPADKPRETPPANLRAPTSSRRVALEALVDVAGEGAYATLALDKRLRGSNLSPEDRRLATALFYGTIEKRIVLDYILSKFMERPSDDPLTQENLRMGIYQVYYMNIPQYAACGEAVALSRALGREALCPLVNAVLRKAAREKDNLAWPVGKLDRLSLESSTPPWLIRALMADLGDAEAEAFLRYIPESYYTSIHANTLRTTEEELATMLRGQGFYVERGKVPGALRVQGGGLGETDAYRRGLFEIQGEASMLAAMALGVKSGMQVFDACAAPGGKSFHISQLMRGSGRVHAMDLHEHRVKLIEAGAQRLGLENIRPRVGDARRPVPTLEGMMDAVLVDAPCSGLGIVGKADVKYRIKPEELAELPETQAAILEASATYVKPGGALVYSTCTVFRAENRGVVEGFLEKHPDFSLQGLEKRLPEPFAARVQGGMVQLLPNLDGVDGFFIARMVRKK